jgi:hypothetical protein
MNYVQGRGMSERMKLWTHSLPWLTLGCSAALIADNLVIRIILLVVLGALLFILSCSRSRCKIVFYAPVLSGLRCQNRAGFSASLTSPLITRFVAD